MPAEQATEQTPQRVRLGELMEDRRIELGLRWQDVAQAGDTTYETLRAVRHGTGDIRPLTKRGIEVGLQWERGSIDRILDGKGDPVPAGAPHGRGDGHAYADRRLQDVADAVDGMDADPELKAGLMAFAAAFLEQQDGGQRKRNGGAG